MRKSTGFALIAVLALAGSIGAGMVALCAFDTLILRPSNAPHAETVYEVGRVNHENQSYSSYLDLGDRNRSFDRIAALLFAQEGLDSGDGHPLAWGYNTSGNYLDTFHGMRGAPGGVMN